MNEPNNTNDGNDAAISGETPIDPSGLKIKGITTRSQLSDAEAQSIRPVLVKYLSRKPSRRIAPFDLDWCQKLHREMFGAVWEWAGQIRTHDLNIGLTFSAIQENLAMLLADLHAWPTFGMSPVEQAARLHFRAVQIHPFENGNGRWSRMLANIWLKQNGHGVILWPEETIGVESKIRGEYITAIRKADEGDLDWLLEIHRRFADG